MRKYDFLDKKQHGTSDFPVEYYYVDHRHPSYRMAFHWHNEWEMIRVLKGTLQLTLDEEQYTVSSGDILLLPGETLHGGEPENCIYECLVFDLYGLFKKVDSVKPMLRPFYRGEVVPYRFFTKSDFYPNLVMDCFSQDRSSLCLELETFSALAGLFAWLVRENRFSAAESDNSWSGRIKPVLEYIEMHYGESLSLDTLAQVAGMNARYFCKVFQSLTHTTTMNYVNFYRIEQAGYLLDSSELPVTRIAAECGFWESSYFTKVFKKYKGITPKDYRHRKP